ncbi:hypothetical protein GCM10022422_16240 [Flavobacterium ginsengisoli]|uniref:Uncharacterized protein n=1 Tax=Flavobacterium ginsengisoli TaxID=871694 RepID=A0ABP7F9E8_9FLAO
MVSCSHSVVYSSFFLSKIRSLKYLKTKERARKAIKTNVSLIFKLGRKIFLRISEIKNINNDSCIEIEVVACQLFIDLVLI